MCSWRGIFLCLCVPFPGDPGIEPASPAVAGRFFTTEPVGSPEITTANTYSVLITHQALFEVLGYVLIHLIFKIILNIIFITVLK